MCLKYEESYMPSMAHTRVRVLIAVVVALLAASASFAADDQLLFTPSYLPISSKTAEGKDLVWDKTFRSVQVINFNSDALVNVASKKVRLQTQSQTAASVSFVVGFDTYTAVLDHVEYREADNYSWFGRMEGSDFLSHFAIVKGAVAGEIWGPGWRRSVLTRNGGTTYLVEYDEAEVSRLLQHDQLDDSVLSSIAPQVIRKAASLSDSRFSRVVPPRGCAATQVLVEQENLAYLYDESADEAFGRDETRVHAFLQSLADGINAANANSNYPSYRVNLVEVVKADGYTAGARLIDDYEWAENSSPQVAAIKEKHGHNTVIGFVVGSSPSAADTLAGQAFGDYTDFVRFGIDPFHLVRVGGGAIAAEHEWGHNQNMHHQKSDPATPQNVSPYYGYVESGFGSDIMATYVAGEICDNCVRFQAFSNFNAFYKGKRIGALDASNAWAIPLAFRAFGSKPACVPK